MAFGETKNRSLYGTLVLAILLAIGGVGQAQKYITYEAGKGTRDAGDPDVWILYQRVKAVHDGITLYADSALLNNATNDFTAYGNVKVVVTDTTTITGDRLYYDGMIRMLDIWSAPKGMPNDTVLLRDGRTLLKTKHIFYDRNTSTATYNNWGYTTQDDKRLVSRVGNYNSDTKEFLVYDQVVMTDSNMDMTTDSMTYNMNTHIAEYWTPTYIYTDTALLYSERGYYYSDKRYALSLQASHVESGEKIMESDTLHYYEETEHGIAIGNVWLVDTINNIISTSRYAETDQSRRLSIVTDSALVRLVQKPDEGDTLSKADTTYLHADSIWIFNDSLRHLQSMDAYRHVKVFKSDAQGMCDSLHYEAADSLVQMYNNPTLWSGQNQCLCDTLLLWHDSTGLKRSELHGNFFAMERLDNEKYNQVKGRNAVVYFRDGKVDYADVLGNAQLLYHLTEEDSDGQLSIVGVNMGEGSEIRIHFEDDGPSSVVVKGNPDMQAYPLDKLEVAKRLLDGFDWRESHRPKKPLDVFVW